MPRVNNAYDNAPCPAGQCQTEDCCAKTCQGYTCPADNGATAWVLKAGASSIACSGLNCTDVEW